MMIISKKIPNLVKLALTLATVLYVLAPFVSHAQTGQQNGINLGRDLLGAGGASKGKAPGTAIDSNQKSYKEIRRIRSLMNKKEYMKAAMRSITVIQAEERNARFDMAPTAYFKEAYNILCASSAALGAIEYATEACEASLQYNPDHWESLKARATLYFLTKDYERSLIDFKTALDHAPDKQDIVKVLKQNISVVEEKIETN